MTAPTDCDPLWLDIDNEYEEIYQAAVAQLPNPLWPRYHDLRGQISEQQMYAMTDVPVVGAWL